jgi:hypothetical protein
MPMQIDRSAPTIHPYFPQYVKPTPAPASLVIKTSNPELGITYPLSRVTSHRQRQRLRQRRIFPGTESDTDPEILMFGGVPRMGILCDSDSAVWYWVLQVVVEVDDGIIGVWVTTCMGGGMYWESPVGK